MDNDSFRTGAAFVQALAQMLIDENEFNSVAIPRRYLDAFEEIVQKDEKKIRMADIFRIFKRWCADTDKPIVLMIDEIDSATNNQVFLDFLAQLRDGYLSRETKGTATFQSVILAGVTDVKNLKRKLHPDEESFL